MFFNSIGFGGQARPKRVGYGGQSRPKSPGFSGQARFEFDRHAKPKIVGSGG